ncbi:DUF397 domain-containing protein [Streptomyces griseorubiginosus]|uniref:DUF397 domain-containing protein n=1 Tax=Streptomyces griseorubiginosus TaxID=67304 RepID=UPI00367CE07A
MQPIHWRKSSYSGDGSNCVEIAAIPTAIHVRDSKTPEGHQLTFPAAAWLRFISHALAHVVSATSR